MFGPFHRLGKRETEGAFVVVSLSLTRIEKASTHRRRWRSEISDQRSHHLSETKLRSSTRRRFKIWSPWTKLSRFSPHFWFLKIFSNFRLDFNLWMILISVASFFRFRRNKLFREVWKLAFHISVLGPKRWDSLKCSLTYYCVLCRHLEKLLFRKLAEWCGRAKVKTGWCFN